MKNQYVGDVGDFCIYGLLRALLKETGLTLGFNWYLTRNDPARPSDGKYVTYLNRRTRLGQSLRPLDDELYNGLRRIVVQEKRRSIGRIERSGLLPAPTLFFSRRLEDYRRRENWHRRALAKLKEAEVVFLDPDNGVTLTTRGRKHASLGEIRDYFARGQSVIAYNQRGHQSQADYEARFRALRREMPGAAYLRLRAHHGTDRDFCFFLQPGHQAIMERAAAFLARWAPHFTDETEP
jgi:hypothetical protein